MVVAVDLASLQGGNLVYKDQSELTVVVANKQWRTPSNFLQDSLALYLNGQVLDRFSDNGFTILGDDEFELKIAVPNIATDHVFFVSYIEE